MAEPSACALRAGGGVAALLLDVGTGAVVLGVGVYVGGVTSGAAGALFRVLGLLVTSVKGLAESDAFGFGSG